MSDSCMNSITLCSVTEPPLLDFTCCLLTSLLINKETEREKVCFHLFWVKRLKRDHLGGKYVNIDNRADDQ